MSDVNENAPVESPNVAAPATADVGQAAVAGAEQVVEAVAVGASTAVQEVEKVVGDTVAESAPVMQTLVQKVEALPAEVLPVFHEFFAHVHDALENVSLQEALNRFYAIAKVVKAKVAEL